LLGDAAAHARVEHEQRRAGDGRDWIELEAADPLDNVADGLRLGRDREPLGVER
jgi:hypothetical protein